MVVSLLICGSSSIATESITIKSLSLIITDGDNEGVEDVTVGDSDGVEDDGLEDTSDGDSDGVDDVAALGLLIGAFVNPSITIKFR